jgi:cell wall-associated NlpC family hydrolase
MMKDSRNTESIDACAVGQYPRFRRVRQALVTLLLLAGLSGFATAGTAVVAPAAGASAVAPAAGTATLGDRVLNAAETRAGDWYQWAAAGPSTFDCSGLVVWAAGRLGIYVPHSTYSMLAGTAHLYRIPLSSARRGDLMFYGSGHVEINTMWYHMTFGAQQTGTRVGWHAWNSYWAPTMAMRFR